MFQLRIDGGGENLWKDGGNVKAEADKKATDKKAEFNLADELKRMKKNGEKLTYPINQLPDDEPAGAQEFKIPQRSELEKLVEEKSAELDRLRKIGANKDVSKEINMVNDKYEETPVENGQNKLDN